MLLRVLEPIKSILLVGLVISSVYLSGQIWLTGPASLRLPGPRSYVQEGRSDSLAMQTVIRPRLYLRDESGKWYGTVNMQGETDDEWERIRKDLAAVPLGEAADWLSVDEQLQPPYVRIEFPYDLTWPEWKQLWQAEGTSVTMEHASDGHASQPSGWPKFDSIVLKPESDGSLSLMVQNDEQAWLFRGEAEGHDVVEELLMQPGEEPWVAYVESPPIPGVKWARSVLVPESPGDLRPLRAEPVRPPEAQLARSFFSDMSVVRQGEGMNGAKLYNDGQRLLSFSSNGLVEYQAFLSERDIAQQSFLPGFADASEFILQHGGWPDGLYLWNTLPIYEPGSLDLAQGDRKVLGYHFEFTWLAEGLPVIGGVLLNLGQAAGPSLPEPAGPVQVLVYNGGIQAYSSADARLIGEGEAEPAKSLREVISNLSVTEPLELVDAQLIYYAPPGAPWWEPAWLLRTASEGRIVLDALHGEVLMDSR